MAETRRVTIDRFDGGITGEIRNQEDITRCSHVSHFDIYTDPTKLIPLPGYVADETYDGSAIGMRSYNIGAVFYNTLVPDNSLVAVGTKTDGTDNTLFYKAAPTDASWSKFSAEGAYDLRDQTFLTYNNGYYFFLTENAGNTYVSTNTGSAVVDAAGTVTTATTETHLVAAWNSNAKLYMNGISSTAELIELKSDGTTATAHNASSAIRDFTNLADYFWYTGTDYKAFMHYVFGWDFVSTNPTYKIPVGPGPGRVLEQVDGNLVVVCDEFMMSDTNYDTEVLRTTGSMRVSLVDGSAAQTLVRIPAASITNATIKPFRTRTPWGMTFYARIPTSADGSTMKEGIWGIGRATPNSPLALSLYLDTSGLGDLYNYHNFGSHHYFVWDSSDVHRISRLGTTTYDATSVYESLLFNGGTAQAKSLQGVTVSHEPLASGQSVTVKYRLNTSDSWTTLETNSTASSKRTVAKRLTETLGKFDEIQFRIETTGGSAAIRNFSFDYMVLTDLP